MIEVRPSLDGTSMKFRLALTSLALLSVLEAVRVSFLKTFSIDEFQYAHAAWLLSHGAVPYRDFFEVHLPLVYQALAPLFWLAGDDPEAVVLLRAGMLPFLGLTCWAAFRLNRRAGRLAAWVTPPLLLGCPAFITFATEIRPDPVALAFFLAALAVLAAPRGRATLRVDAPPRQGMPQVPPGGGLPSPDGRGSRPSHAWLALLSGVFAVVAIWGSQKVLLYGTIVFGLALVLDLALSHSPKLLLSPRLFLAGAGIALGAIALYLTLSSSWSACWHWCFAWAAAHERLYPGFSPARYLVPSLTDQPWLPALAAFGVVNTVGRLARLGRDAFGDEDVLLVVALPATFGSYALQRAPFPYSLIPFLALEVVFAARGVAALEVLLPRAGRMATWAGAITLLALLAVPIVRLENRLSFTNAGQREVLARIRRLTAPADVAYDNSGSYVARPHAYFFFYTDAYLREAEADRLSREVPQALLRGCVLWLRDLRSDTLPRNVQTFLAEHFQPLDGDLWLWGQRFQSPVRATFLASRDDQYFVDPPDAVKGALRIDDRPVSSVTFSLTAGPHSVEYSGPERSISLLWLPRDGKTWSPKRGLPRTFSWLF